MDLCARPIAIVPVMANSSCCIAASIEAKKYGVKTGTLVSEAKERCPERVLVLAHPALYVHDHHRLLKAIDCCIPIYKIGSIDEAECRLLGREREPNPALNKLLDNINKKHGNSKMYFGTMQHVLDSAPMRISFKQIPDVALEYESGKNEPWKKRLSQSRVIADAEHQKHEPQRRSY